MKYLLIPLAILLTACDPVEESRYQLPSSASKAQSDAEVTTADGCTLETSSKMSSKQKVGKVRNLVKDAVDTGHVSRCTVKFDITVDGKDYHLEETELGLERIESLCYYATERAKKELLLELGGDFESKSNLTCRHTES
jgi:hypothetical protein